MQAPERLPRGRHRLTREEVSESQSQRLVRGTVDAVSSVGYAKTSVAEIVRRAGVSRETFYAHFEDKLECFLAAYDSCGADLLTAITDTQQQLTADARPLERVDVALGCYLDTLAADPAMAQTFLVEVYSAGPRSFQRSVERREQYIDAACAVLNATTDEDRFIISAFLAATNSLVIQLICSDRTAEAGELLEPLSKLARVMLTASTSPRLAG